MTDNRKRKRYDIKKDEAKIDFSYDFKANVSVVKQGKIEDQSVKYTAHAMNVSAEGICLHSEEKLEEGEILDLEYYVPGTDYPIHMKGQVRWSKEGMINPVSGYDTGVLVKSVDGNPVDQSIYYDYEYHVYWSNVLESVLGKFRILEQKKRQSE